MCQEQVPVLPFCHCYKGKSSVSPISRKAVISVFQLIIGTVAKGVTQCLYQNWSGGCASRLTPIMQLKLSVLPTAC